MNTQIWAHRGASEYAPENTLEAFELAIEQNADGIELDVQLSKDGELVVIHDETLARVSGVKGEVRQFTLEELQSLNVNRTKPEYKKAKIPTLEEVYRLMKPTALVINVELKTGIYWYPHLEEKVMELTRKYQMEEQVIFSSFNHNSIRRMKELDSQVQTGILFSDVMVDICGYAGRLGVNALHPALYHTKMDGVLEGAKEQGLALHVWTVNREEDMLELMKKGTEAIITNDPQKAVRLRR